ncbi:MAG: Lrp/AsnC family transcriptional regulator [Candidatus Heimdallarchaeaceae archaeon]
MSTFIIDQLDLAIIEILKKDSRISKQEIAEKLKTTRQTIHNRIKALEENGIILQYTCITNDKKLGKEITAIILVQLDRAASVWNFTAKELWKRQKSLEIIEMHHLAGEYDVLIKMRTNNIESLEGKLSIITSIKGVSRTHTMICLSSFEYGFQLTKEKQKKR